MLSRSSFLRLATATTLLPLLSARVVHADNSQEISRETIFNDAEAPVAGNPEGDVTIVDFFDYNCPYCKKAAPSLEKLTKADGQIKLIYKDWPILAETSMFGAQLALGAKYQGKYIEAHHALMNVPGYGISQDIMKAAVRGAGVDMDRLSADMQTHAEPILNLLKRNLAIADAIGLQGTPGFLIGPFRVNQALNYEGFRHAVADARARDAGK
jgi:protein-disulfide isomerase